MEYLLEEKIKETHIWAYMIIVLIFELSMIIEQA